MANISSIKLPSGNTYDIKDDNALPLTGGTVTGPVTFGDSVDMDESTIGDLVVTGSASFVNYPTSITTSTGTNQLTLSAATKYSLTTPGGSFIFTTPSDSDTKVSTAAVGSGTTYYPVVGSNTTSAATKYYDSTGMTYAGTNGTANGTNGAAVLTLGNSTASTTANWKAGKLVLYGSTAYATTLVSGAPTAARTITFPNATGTVALTGDIPTSAASHTTGISISDHGTSSIGSASNWSAGSASTWAFEEISIPNVTSAGSASTWAFEEKTIPNVTSAGSASTWTFEEKSIPNVTSAGSASSWTFEEKTIPNVTSAGSASSWTFEEKTIPNVTAAGSGSASLTFTMDTTDTKKLKIAFSHSHTAPTIGTAIKVQSKSGGSNGTAPTLGTAIKVQSKSGGSNGSAPTLGTAIKVQSKSGGGNGTAPTLGTAIKVQSKSSGSNSTVPTLGTAIKVQSKKSGSNSTAPSLTVTSTTVVTGKTHTVTDSGHTHTLS